MWQGFTASAIRDDANVGLHDNRKIKWALTLAKNEKEITNADAW